MRGLRRSSRLGKLVLLALLAFSIRAVVPAGFMPASLADGGPFVLCRDASAATLSMMSSQVAMQASDQTQPETSAHAHGAIHTHDSMQAPIVAASSTDDEHATHAAAWEHCSFAAGSTAALVPDQEVPVPAVLPAGIRFSPPAAHIQAAPFSRYRARAPPA